MRIHPEFAPSSPRPFPGGGFTPPQMGDAEKDLQAARADGEFGPRPKPRREWILATDMQSLEYDDGSWM